MPSERVRVMVLTPIPAPYRVAQLDALARRPVDLRVVYLASVDPMRRWGPEPRTIGHDRVVLPELGHVRRGQAYVHLSYGLAGELRRFDPEVVIAGGWDQPAHLEALALRRAFGYRFVWWVESTLRDGRSSRPALAAVKRRLARAADGVLVPGSASAAYARTLGVLDGRIFVAPNAVDVEAFAQARVDRSGREGPVRFLFVGRLDPVKGLRELVRAWPMVGPGALLEIAGDGPMRRELATRSRTGVRLLGPLARRELLEAYARADALVVPSRWDAWGLVVNEAMAAGLPVVASDAAGAADDLVAGTGAGTVVPAGDPDALARAMRELVEDPDGRLGMGERASKVVEGFTPMAWAEGAEAAIRAVQALGVG